MKSPVITKVLTVSDKTKEMMVDYFTEFKRVCKVAWWGNIREWKFRV